MDSFSLKKQDYVVRIAGFMLEQGISACSLKKMAEAASTSDRMLMHYFKDKDEIMLLALSHISQEMMALLMSNPNLRLSFEAFIPFLLESIENEHFKPYFDIWFELIHLASVQSIPYASVAKEIGDTYWQWLIRTNIVDSEEWLEEKTALLFAFVEGLVLLNKMGMHDKGKLAATAMLQLIAKRT